MMTRDRPTIAIDCHHVMSDKNNAVRLFVSAVYGTAYTPEDYMATLEPLPGALEALGHLKKRFCLVIVTARTAPEVEEYFSHA